MGMWYRSTGYLSTGYLTVGDVIVIYIKVWVCNHLVFKSMGMEIQPRKCGRSKYRVPKYIESIYTSPPQHKLFKPFPISAPSAHLRDKCGFRQDGSLHSLPHDDWNQDSQLVLKYQLWGPHWKQ